MKKIKRSKLVLIIVAILVVTIVGVCFWYFQYKKPHDEAVASFNNAVKDVKTKNSELETVINGAQAILDAGERPYDEATINNLTVAISDAGLAKRKVPKLPSKTEDILSATGELLKPLDYSSVIANITDTKTAFENSIKQMKQITNPTGDFVVQRLQGIDGISACQAVTEDHDPNGNLNKQGGYTAAIYFSSPWINQDDVYGNDIVDKGTDCGGCIEVYSTAEEANTRNAYLSSFDGAGMLNPGSHTVLGTIVIRTSKNLTATQQNDLTQKITDNLLTLQ